MVLVCLAVIVSLAAGARQTTEPMSLATMPMHMYAKACGKRIPVALSVHSSRMASKVPGAGLSKVVPYETVLKDGFFEVACVKDMLFSHGDKFGDGKFDYTLGEVSNVSIVRYSDVIAKEDRKEMTHETCFEFCRTVPDMLFFGLTHGRDCYCTPYYKAVAGDSSDCDEVCASKPTQMCGGKTKSLIFEMHECADTQSNLEAANRKASDSLDALSTSVKDITAVAEAMQSGAARLQETFGQAGDPTAADLFQAAKVFAGEVTHAAEEKGAIAAALAAASEESGKLAGADFKTYEANEKAQSVTSKMETLSADAEDAVEDLAALSKLASPVDAGLEGSPSKQYYSLMYFVDKAHEKDPSTCTGAMDKKPMVGVSADECANACDAEVLTCVGYSYYPEDQFCFLFSKFTEVTYYTGCGGTSFLQKDEQPVNAKASKDASMAAAAPTCYAKLSEFEGTTVAPNPSGKCANCLKKATKAARCFQ